jgi:hypothetical protein
MRCTNQAEMRGLKGSYRFIFDQLQFGTDHISLRHVRHYSYYEVIGNEQSLYRF